MTEAPNPRCGWGLQTLVWPRAVEVRRVLAKDTPEMGLAEDEHTVRALAPHSAEEALAVAFCRGVR